MSTPKYEALDPMNRTPYTCAICGKRDKGTPNQVTCSDRCFREWRNRKLKAKRERELVRLMSGEGGAVSDLERCLAEQNACREYIEGGGKDVEGAKRGAEDWLWEEIIIRLRDRKMEIRRKSEIPA